MQKPLPLDERPLSQIVASQRTHVEGDERRVTAPEHQVIEPRSALSVKANNLAVEHGAIVEFAVDEQRKVPEPGERIGVAGDERRGPKPQR